MSITIAFAGFALLAFVSLVDKKLLSGARPRSIGAYTFFMSAFSIALVLAVPFGQKIPEDFFSWLLIVFDAFLFFIGLLTMFQGIKKSEVSHIGPLIGASVPFFTVFLSGYFLGEILSGRQIAAIGFLILGSLIISFERSETHNGWHRGMLWGVASGLFFAGSHTISKYLYSQIGFVGGISLMRAALGVMGLCLLFIPSIRREIFSKNSEESKPFLPVFFNMVAGVAGVLFIQFAISIGSVSVVNSLESVRYALLVILVAIVSHFKPKLFKEKYFKWEGLQEAVAVLVIIAGLFFLS